MDTIKAFAMGEANRGKEMKIFDWEKAANLIVEKNASTAAAGLREDWEWTGGDIYCDREIVEDSYTFLGSTWATPIIIIDGEEFECFQMNSEAPHEGSGTKWPEYAKKIIQNAE